MLYQILSNKKVTEDTGPSKYMKALSHHITSQPSSKLYNISTYYRCQYQTNSLELINTAKTMYCKECWFTEMRVNRYQKNIGMFHNVFDPNGCHNIQLYNR